MTVSKQSIAHNLRGHQVDRGWSGRQIADRSELSVTTVQRMLTGDGGYTPANMSAVLSAFSLSWTQFMSEIENEPVPDQQDQSLALEEMAETINYMRQKLQDTESRLEQAETSRKAFEHDLLLRFETALSSAQLTAEQVERLSERPSAYGRKKTLRDRLADLFAQEEPSPLDDLRPRRRRV